MMTEFELEYDTAALGSGNWQTWRRAGRATDELLAAADVWATHLTGVAKPWLCWNVSPRWSLLQQRLILEVGWTPVVGYDPRVGPPPLAPGSILVEFNERFGFPVMKPHFVLEFAFLLSDRLAFWHSDLLCRRPVMTQLAQMFSQLQAGQIAAVRPRESLRHAFSFRRKRYFELVGCTTREASADQFARGAGWWRHMADHPNCPSAEERARRQRYYYEFGVGIRYWQRTYGGSVLPIAESLVAEGHCTSINRTNYARATAKNATRNMSRDLDANYDVMHVARSLGIADLLD